MTAHAILNLLPRNLAADIIGPRSGDDVIHKSGMKSADTTQHLANPFRESRPHLFGEGERL